jgi:hypothetical protein
MITNPFWPIRLRWHPKRNHPVTNSSDYEAPLEAAITAMREQMAKPENVAKPHWRESSPEGLGRAVEYNLAHLFDAVYKGNQPEAVRRAANVANHAWMLADLSELDPIP